MFREQNSCIRNEFGKTRAHLWLHTFFAFVGVLPKYFSSERSMAQFRLPESVQYLVGFGRQNNTIVIVGLDGR